MELGKEVNKLLLIQPSNEGEAKELLLAINRLMSEMSADIKKDIDPHYVEIEKARGRYKDENTALWQKRTHVRQELINFIEDGDV